MVRAYGFIPPVAMSSFSKLLNRFDFVHAHWDARIGVCLAVIWFVIVMCAISSIRSQGFGVGQQRFWIAAVILFPIVGVLAYLPFSIKRDDLPPYFRFKPKERVNTRSSGKSPGRNPTSR